MWLRDFPYRWIAHRHAVHAFVDRSRRFIPLSNSPPRWNAYETALAPAKSSCQRGYRLIRASSSQPLGALASMRNGATGCCNRAQLLSLCPGEKPYYSDFGTIALAKALTQTFVYDGDYSRFRDRIHGRPAGALSQHRFLGYIQNHDQVGNRATGDRIVQISGVNRAKIAAAIVLLSPFIPLIFQGEEWGASTPFQYFADHKDPALARAVTEGRKKEFSAFGWDPASIPDPEIATTFERSKLAWKELAEPKHAEMLAWYRHLIRLRRTANMSQRWNRRKKDKRHIRRAEKVAPDAARRHLRHLQLGGVRCCIPRSAGD